MTRSTPSTPSELSASSTPSPDRSTRTGYARLNPRQARGVLVGLLLVTLFMVGITLSPWKSTRVGNDDPTEGDIALFMAKVERIRQGQGYYEAAAAELAARGYPTKSPFNWRTPLLLGTLGKLPNPKLGRALLGLLALALILLSFEALARDQGHGIGRPLVCVLLLSGPLMPCVLGDLHVLPGLWAGVLIGLSLCAYGLNRPGWGVATGLAALFVRELALPYCVLAALFALWNRRTNELAAWVAGFAGWSLFLGWHVARVSAMVTPDARAHTEGWIQFGGAPFVLSAAQMTAYLLLLPQWITALYFVAAMLGFAGWNTPLGQRAGLAACLYVVAFAIVGQEFNQYWGTLIAPLFCLGAAQFPASIRDLWNGAHLRGSTRRVAPSHG